VASSTRTLSVDIKRLWVARPKMTDPRVCLRLRPNAPRLSFFFRNSGALADVQCGCPTQGGCKLPGSVCNRASGIPGRACPATGSMAFVRSQVHPWRSPCQMFLCVPLWLTGGGGFRLRQGYAGQVAGGLDAGHRRGDGGVRLRSPQAPGKAIEPLDYRSRQASSVFAEASGFAKASGFAEATPDTGCRVWTAWAATRGPSARALR
jgi:hypothetical protein